MQTNFTPDRVYSTPASIEAFCLAVADRRKWHRGEATEMHLAEPLSGEATAVRRRDYRPPSAHFDAAYAQGYRAGYAAARHVAATEDTEPR